MGYIENNLLPSEEIVHKAHIHWFIFVRPTLLLLFGYWLYGTSSTLIHYIGVFLLPSRALSLLRRGLLKLGRNM